MSNLFPEAFRQRMINSLGEEWDAFEAAHLQDSPVSVRTNSHKKNLLTSSGQIPWSSEGKYLAERPVFTLDPHFHAGSYYVQEASSMFLEHALRQTIDLSKPICALDLCAAPGGKSTHLLSLLSKESFLVANEVIRSRASVLAENIQKWGYPNVVVTGSDPENFQKLSSTFDLIVVDAPCSGEGLFRKDPDAMKEWSTANAQLCASRQKRILNTIWPSLKTGGILIYCTCTYNEEENDLNLKWLQEEHDVEFLEVLYESDWGIKRNVVEKQISFQCFPHKVKGEGFFLSVIRKTGSERESRMKSNNDPFTIPPKKTVDECQSWLTENSGLRVVQFKETLLALPKDRVELVEWLSNHLHIVQAGTALAEDKHHKFIPDHALALSVVLNKNAWPCLPVNREQALTFLRKENLVIDHNLPRGFALVTYEGEGIGWANILDNRINNLYPSSWRIRMAGK